MHSSITQLDFTEKLNGAGLSWLIPHVMPLATSCIAMELTSAGTLVLSDDDDVPDTYTDESPIGTSKLGGHPDLPLDFEWPLVEWEDGDLVALPFLAQINLAEVAELNIDTPLPKTGHLLLFFDHTYNIPNTQRTRSFYVSDGAPFSRIKLPENAIEFSEHRPLKIDFRGAWSLPDIYSQEIQDIFAHHGPQEESQQFEQMDKYAELLRSATPVHYLLGYQHCRYDDSRPHVASIAAGFNFPEESERNAYKLWKKDALNWQLFIQFDCEFNKGVSWGNGGLIYGYMRTDALKKGDFSKVIFHSQ